MATPWIPFPLTLPGKEIELVSLQREHIQELDRLAKDSRIWEFYSINGSDSRKLTGSLETAIAEREQGTQYPFVIVHRQQHNIIGSTRYLDIQPAHRKLEIGWTWLHPDYWGTSVNLACKYALLTHCFETLQTVRVQLKTDENNIRSRKAIQKIGGQLEGIIRNDMIRDNGTRRNSAYFGIIAEDWAEVKKHLQTLLAAKQ